MAVAKKKKAPREHLRRKVRLLVGDANALADELKNLAPTAREPHAALMVAAKASEIALAIIGPSLWGALFQKH